MLMIASPEREPESRTAASIAFVFAAMSSALWAAGSPRSAMAICRAPAVRRSIREEEADSVRSSTAASGPKSGPGTVTGGAARHFCSSHNRELEPTGVPRSRRQTLPGRQGTEAPLITLQRHPERHEQEDCPNEPLSPRAGRPGAPSPRLPVLRQEIRQQRQRRRVKEAHEHEDCTQQHELSADGKTRRRIDELWQERQEKQGGFRVED